MSGPELISTLITNITSPEWLSVMIFGLVLFMLFTERFTRLTAGIVGLFLIWIAGLLAAEDVLHFVKFDVLILLFSMFIIAEALSMVGFFKLITYYVLKSAKGDGFRLFLFLCMVTFVLSGFIDNVSTIIVMIKLSFDIAKIAKFNPLPLILMEIFSSNIGGMATQVGDPPNIMIASYAGLSFNDFILNLFPVAIIGQIALMITACTLFKKDIFWKEKIEFKRPETPKTLNIGIVLFLTLIALFFLQEQLNIHPHESAFLIAVIMALFTGKQINEALGKIDWETLLFIGSLFLIVGMMEKTGVLTNIANELSILIGGSEFLGITLVYFFSTFASGIIDNIPCTAALSSILITLEAEHPQLITLWWALAAGAGMGGNLTPIGSSATVVGLRMMEHEIRIKPIEFIKKALILNIGAIILIFIAQVVMYVIF